jgi:hypothetical protein
MNSDSYYSAVTTILSTELMYFYSSDNIKKNEMGTACSTYVGQQR